MGKRVKNQYPRPHYNLVSGTITRIGLAWHLHETDDNDAVILDVTLGEATPTEWSSLEGTASQLAFDTAATAVWGTNYSGLDADARSGMRAIIDAGLP